MGVWIEIQFWLERKWNILVTPFVGVWIEIFCYYNTKNVLTTSLPSWECGLKYNSNKQRDRRSEVTPFVGVWIEILN